MDYKMYYGWKTKSFRKDIKGNTKYLPTYFYYCSKWSQNLEDCVMRTVRVFSSRDVLYVLWNSSETANPVIEKDNLELRKERLFCCGLYPWRGEEGCLPSIACTLLELFLLTVQGDCSGNTLYSYVLDKRFVRIK